ncbi:MAG: sugar ABC transporter ATP-binding protein [Spirochaetales bacterium]|nr:sugar ABC transporter ATP-binding protein [Spirochaetales bacterium]
MQTNNILEMSHISKSFPGVKALDDVSLAVRKGSVHSLMGENGAGKSTLMNCLFGLYSIDEGEIILDGEKVVFSNPAEALSHHVSMVHQELNQVPDRSVMENIWLGRFPMKGIFLDSKLMFNETEKILQDLDIEVVPEDIISELTVSQKQMVEIAKAVSYDSKIIVMDEPTSSLTENETEHLFEIINKLKEKDISIIYISHKMEEILRISDDVTVMRDGKLIGTKSASNITTNEIIKMMVGRELKQRYPVKEYEQGEPLLQVKALSSESGQFSDVNFVLKRGEILGISGLVGARRTEVLETIFGSRTKSSGEIYLNEKKINNDSPEKSMKNGFAMLTEERRFNGIFPELNIMFNMMIANLGKYHKRRFLDSKLVKNDVAGMIKALSIKTVSEKIPIKNLSGGNQQKVLLARWLLRNPDVLLLDEPTRGIDVGAKYEIYQLMNDLASQGRAIIMVSSEMPELLGVADRILVMSNGKQAGIFDTKSVTQEQIMEASAMYL